MPFGFIARGLIFLYHESGEKWRKVVMHMWVKYNPNPVGRQVGDCAVRAISKALNIDWESAYALLSTNGFLMGDMPSSDSVWGATLRQYGFSRFGIPMEDAPDERTRQEFQRFIQKMEQM